MSDFMPEGYVEPKTGTDGTWFKLNDKNKSSETERIRIMGSFNHPNTAIMGWEAWSEVTDIETGAVSSKPRRMENTSENYDKLTDIDRDGSHKHFWAIQIYNLDRNEVQIWGISQRTIQRQIRSFAENPNWGDPMTYVIAVTRQGLGLKTVYTLMPEPNIEPASDDIIKKVNDAKIDVRALFADDGKGLNPFGYLAEGENDGIPF